MAMAMAMAMAMVFTNGKGNNVNDIHRWQVDGVSLAHCSSAPHHPPSLAPGSAPLIVWHFSLFFLYAFKKKLFQKEVKFAPPILPA